MGMAPAGVALCPDAGKGVNSIRMVPRPFIDAGIAAWTVIAGLCQPMELSPPGSVEPGCDQRLERFWVQKAQDYFLNPSFHRTYLGVMRGSPLGSPGHNIQDSFKRLKCLGKSVNVITAKKDDIICTPELEEFIKTELPEAQVTQFDNVHELPRDRPHELADMIVKLCDSLPARAAKGDYMEQLRFRTPSLGRPHRRQRLCEGLPSRAVKESRAAQPRRRSRTWDFA